ncbi:MAG: hypothetical protein J6N52_09735 [Clostridia bacterium]|nr:hypothetical protein [Clostridia bacterium]
MKKIKKIALLLCVMMVSVFSITGLSAPSTPILKVDQIMSSGGTIVNVPIRLENNTGICGATFKVSYDNRLTLTNIVKGAALSSLTMTKPGSLAANPANIVWDGMEADYTNGVIATLTFIVPGSAGTYNISVSYDDGDILDGNISPVEVAIQNGGITVTGEISQDLPTVSVDNVTSEPGASVNVPIRLENNTGICGATFKVSYDNRLTLTNIVKGAALSSLTMTKPGSLSANPANIVWDGMDEDNTNGVLAILTFTVPSSSGTYNISVNYDDGDILDGNLAPVDIKTVSGAIKVGNDKTAAVIIKGKSVTLVNSSDKEGQIVIAFYDSMGKLISLNTFIPSNNDINISSIDSKAAYAKVMWWGNISSMEPLCKAETVDLI